MGRIKYLVKKLKLNLLKLGVLHHAVGSSNDFEFHRKSNFKIGKGSRIGDYNYFSQKEGTIEIGDRVLICNKCHFIANNGIIIIGNGCQIGDNNYITGQGGVYIGQNVLTASNVSIIANEHNYTNLNTPVILQGENAVPVKIGNDSWIGINVTILGRTNIGKHCIVGAGSVVKGEFPDYSVIAGAPAKIVKKYDFESKKWQKL